MGMKIVLALYIAGVILCSLFGYIGMCCFASDDMFKTEYRACKALLKYCLVFPYGLAKVLDILQEGEQI